MLSCGCFVNLLITLYITCIINTSYYVTRYDVCRNLRGCLFVVYLLSFFLNYHLFKNKLVLFLALQYYAQWRIILTVFVHNPIHRLLEPKKKQRILNDLIQRRYCFVPEDCSLPTRYM